MHNTPPVFCWYVTGLILKWSLQQGGIQALTKLCQQKSQLLYDVIDNSDFYSNPVYKPHRSKVNIPFRLPDENLEALFLKQATELGLKQLKGHKVVGGCRASIYNAMSMTGVQTLVEFMKAFEKNHG
jgi:phosphoserine aminotransferase